MAFLSRFGEFGRLAKDASIYGLGAAVGRAVGVLMAPILTRIFSPAEYGIIALIQLAVSFAVILAGMNIGSGISFYYFKVDDEPARRLVLSTGFAALIVLSAFIAGLLMLFAPQVAALLQMRSEGPVVGYDLVRFLRIAAIGMFFMLMQTGCQSLLRLLHKPSRYLIVELVALTTTVSTVLVLVVWLRHGVEGVFWAGVVGPAVGLACSVIFVVNRFGRVFSWGMLGLILAYAMPQLPAVVINWFQTQLGRVFINYYTNLSEQGLYSIAFQIASIVVLATTAFRLAYDPYALSIMKRPDAPKIYARTYSIFGVGFGLVLALAGAFAKPVLQVLTPPAYHEAHRMVFWLAAAAFYMGANNIVATGIWLTGRTIFTSYAQLLSFVALTAVNLALVPVLGAEGAAISYFVGTLAQSLAYYSFAQRLYPIPYSYWRMHGVIACVMALSWLQTRLVGDAGLIEASALAIPVALAGCLVVLGFGFTAENRAALWQLLTLRRSSARSGAEP